MKRTLIPKGTIEAFSKKYDTSLIGAALFMKAASRISAAEACKNSRDPGSIALQFIAEDARDKIHPADRKKLDLAIEFLKEANSK